MFRAANLSFGPGGKARGFRVVQFALRASDVLWRPRHSVGLKFAAPSLTASTSSWPWRLSEPHGSFVRPNGIENEVYLKS